MNVTDGRTLVDSTRLRTASRGKNLDHSRDSQFLLNLRNEFLNFSLTTLRDITWKSQMQQIHFYVISSLLLWLLAVAIY